ncbi:unnamed protein product [Trichobilharzia szidati]|nr:unnamed protein product [Trichobilharzia szidati]
MDSRSKLVQAFNDYGGRVSSEQLLKFIKEDSELSQEPRSCIKRIVGSIAVIEYGSDRKRYLVLKDLVRDKENLVCNTVCQSTQTSTSQVVGRPMCKVSSEISRPQERPVLQRPTSSVSLSTKASHMYSTYTGSETRLWWLAAVDCRLGDMRRLLGLNPKLANWSDPVHGWSALHYAAKFGNVKCVQLLVSQYHADVNIRNKSGRTPLHIAVVHSQRPIIRALTEDYRADRAIMDYSGYYPYMLLSDDLKSEFEPILTYGQLQRIRSALNILKRKPVTGDCASIPTNSCNKKNDSSEQWSVEFKSPTRPPIRHRRIESLQGDISPFSPTHSSLSRTSTLKPINQNGVEQVRRRPSVFEDILKSAVDAAQNWSPSCSPAKSVSERDSDGQEQHKDSPNESALSSSSSSNDAHARLVQRLDSLISLRHERQKLPSWRLNDSSASCDVGSLDSSGSSECDLSVMNFPSRKSYTIDYRSSTPNSKSSNQSSDRTLQLLLSLLPAPPPPPATTSSLLKKEGEEGKSRKYSISSLNKRLSRNLRRSLSNSSDTYPTSPSHQREFHSLPHGYHSSSPTVCTSRKSLSATALLAETDVRQLLTPKFYSLVRRKASSISQLSIEFMKKHLQAEGPDPSDVEAMKLEIAELKQKLELLETENAELKRSLNHHQQQLTPVTGTNDGNTTN